MVYTGEKLRTIVPKRVFVTIHPFVLHPPPRTKRFAGTADALAAGERLLPAAYATTGAGAGAGVGVGAAGGTVAGDVGESEAIGTVPLCTGRGLREAERTGDGEARCSDGCGDDCGDGCGPRGGAAFIATTLLTTGRRRCPTAAVGDAGDARCCVCCCACCRASACSRCCRA